MPEPHHRCADPSCHQTFQAHEDPEIQTCSTFKVPAFGGAFEELAAARRTVGQDGGKPIQIVHYSDAHRAAGLAYDAGKAEGFYILRFTLAENRSALENWGAFDYELLNLASERGLETDGLSPLEVVRALMNHAYRSGLIMSGGAV
jgi:hypothetical protein